MKELSDFYSVTNKFVSVIELLWTNLKLINIDLFLKTKANKNKLELYKICIIANQIELTSLIIDVACKWVSGSCTFLYLALRHGIV